MCPHIVALEGVVRGVSEAVGAPDSLETTEGARDARETREAARDGARDEGVSIVCVARLVVVSEVVASTLLEGALGVASTDGAPRTRGSDSGVLSPEETLAELAELSERCSGRGHRTATGASVGVAGLVEVALEIDFNDVDSMLITLAGRLKRTSEPVDARSTGEAGKDWVSDEMRRRSALEDVPLPYAVNKLYSIMKPYLFVFPVERQVARHTAYEALRSRFGGLREAAPPLSREEHRVRDEDPTCVRVQQVCRLMSLYGKRCMKVDTEHHLIWIKPDDDQELEPEKTIAS
ncbi:hypothetical protein POSPLADRAFT_1045914 [Postia placenta MAD-698-R-SB12]|uniref:Uncharacterized protein n=1 Tax=Postia placenta MAD-698-R-SB12 TaxID=670580 RepID=A0A1X6N575_9APHY|nr:hypothetical protein POSPLADRAFT_1045914 [Postia placenta MAD-698-R-SB12]OSX63612.1 hypothetical protein POSPLADRAFT_1045914 [Postia placenta MAD-698-R-SB12]